ncbi:MAG: hypothetical protein ACE3JR_01505 [Ectobacillus sp.]
MDEVLKQILSQLQSVNTQIGTLQKDTYNIKQGQESMKADIQGLKQGQESMKADIQRLKQGQESMKADIQELKQGQEKLQKNLVESLGSYTAKIVEHIDSRTEVLNRRIFTLETDIQKMARQQQ